MAKTPSRMPCRGSFCTTATKSARITEANAARFTAPRQVGGLSSRAWRRSAEVILDDGFFDAVGDVLRPLDDGLLVRPARSIVPAWVPRCLRLRLRLGWALSSG